jgi:hypothetical protein
MYQAQSMERRRQLKVDDLSFTTISVLVADYVEVFFKTVNWAGIWSEWWVGMPAT